MTAVAGAPAWPRSVAEVARLVAERTGLSLAPKLRDATSAAIGRAMARAAVTDPTRYGQLISADAAAFDALVAELTVGETYFFREPGQLEFIRREVLPEIAERSGGSAPRVWSAGCASGEEAYSLAIMMHELGLSPRTPLLGTDLSRARLAAARRASYGAWSLRGVPDDVVASYFRRRGHRFELASPIRSAVRFGYLNLAEDAYPSAGAGIWELDLILCRNVLIYFDPGVVRKVAQRLVASLSEGGWLVLGASDPPLADLVPCEVTLTGAGVAYRKAGEGGRRGVLRSLPAPPLPQWIAAAEPPVTPQCSVPRAEPSQSAASRPPDPEPGDLAKRATDCYAVRDYAQAAELAERYTARDGSDATPWAVLVRSLANRGQLADAGFACARALDRHRTSAELTYLHAVLLAAAGRHREAAGAARAALYLDRRMVVAHLALGSALARLKEVAGACRAFRSAERLLAAMPAGASVPYADGQLAERLLELSRAHLAVLEGMVA